LLPLRPLNAVMPQGNIRSVQTAEVTTVEALGARQALTPLRTLQTFSYSVNLLFCRSDLSYYVTLCQQGKLWRALHAPELDPAEAAFRHFEEQAIRLADVELRHAQREAQNEHVEAMVAASEAQAEQLRNDLERHAEQTQLLNNRQQEIRKEVAQLDMQRVASQARLNKALRHIHQLRATSNERIPHLSTRRTES
jgi:septal ring factor EnvC (AmiA/AmiB activator)